MKPLLSKNCVQANITFKGKVQGVGFRFAVEEIALNNSLRGWVKNLSNGDVQAIAQGSRASIDAMINELKESRLGPNIQKLKIKWELCESLFQDFTIEYDF